MARRLFTVDGSIKPERMSDVTNTSVHELARATSVSEAAFGGTMLPDEPQALTCMSAARHYAAAGAAMRAPTPGAILGDPLAAKHFYGGSGSSGEWENFTLAESSPVGTLSLSTAAVCKFVKDKKESAVILSPDYNPDAAAPDGARTQQAGGARDEEPALSFAPRPGLDTSPNFAPELDQPDSRCGFGEKSAANFNPGRSPVQQLAAFRNEAPRWQAPAVDPQFWCQVPAAVAEDPFDQSGYKGGYNQQLVQRNQSPSCTFQG